MACTYTYGGVTYSEAAFRTLLNHLVTQYGPGVDVQGIVDTLTDPTFIEDLNTAPGLLGKSLDGEVKYDNETKQPVSDREYANFTSKNSTSAGRLRSIALKVGRGETLTSREQVIFYRNIEAISSTVDAVISEVAEVQVPIERSLEANYTAEEINTINSLMSSEEFQTYMEENDITSANIQDVLRFFNEQKAGNLRLNNDTLIQLNLLLSRSNFETIDELYSELHSIFYDGQLRSLNIDKLSDSTLFNEEEKRRIASSLTVRGELSDMVLAIGNDLMKGNSSRLGKLSRLEIAQELLVLEPGVTISGMTKVLDPSTVFNQLAEELAGVATMDSLESRVQNIEFDHIKEYFRTSPEFREFMFNLFSKLERVPVFKVSEGQLVEATERLVTTDVVPFLQQGELGNTTLFISTVNRAVEIGEWADQIEQIQTIIKAVEKHLSTFNIDIVGLSERVGKVDLESVVDLLYKAKNLAESVGGEFMQENANSFVEAYNEVFEVTGERKFSYSRMGETTAGTATVKISNPMGQSEMFESFGLIKVGENMYHRVQRGDSLSDTYARAIELLQSGHFWIPASELTGFLTKNKKISVTKLRDPELQRELDTAVKTYIAKQLSNTLIKGNREVIEEMIIWSKVYGYNIDSESVVDVMTRINQFTGNRDSLIMDFPNRFRNFVLRQKVENTMLYQQVLKDFSFQDGSISWNPSSEYAQQLARTMLPLQSIWSDLMNYSIIATEGNLSALLPITTEISEPTLAQERVFYTNFPEALPEFNGEVTPFDNTLIVPTNPSNFIKRNGTVYEKVAEDMSFGKSIFMPQPSLPNDGFYHTDNLGAPRNQPSLTTLRTAYPVGVERSRGKVGKLSPKEANQINKKIDEC